MSNVWWRAANYECYDECERMHATSEKDQQRAMMMDSQEDPATFWGLAPSPVLTQPKEERKELTE